MKTYKLNERDIFVPERWEEVTLEQLMKLQLQSTTLEYISFLVNVPVKELSASNDLKLIEAIEYDLRFCLEPFDIESFQRGKIVFKGEEYSLPSDIGQTSIGQYKDLQLIVMEYDKGVDVDTNYAISMYTKAVSIYLQPLVSKGDYDYILAEEIAKELYQCSAVEVSVWGAFFIKKFRELRNGIVIDAQRLITKKRRFVLDITSFKRRLGSVLHFIR